VALVSGRDVGRGARHAEGADGGGLHPGS
jgi:hypothetical protein